MDFSFTSEQDQLRDTVARLIRQQYDFETRRKVAKSEAGWRPEMWAQFAELGLLGASFSEAEGGFGGGQRREGGFGGGRGGFGGGNRGGY